ncbi:hypothetical protein [Xenorhabdus bharatensis]|uniref:hypothetical protein n=1 Tax=Xenorhabdus bharatensis TaxID=3136256 RepID=UPI0030F44936
MSGKLEVLYPADGSSVIKGQPFSVMVKVSGDASLNNNSKILITSFSGVEYDPENTTDVNKQLVHMPAYMQGTTFYQQIIFNAKDDSNRCTLSFSAGPEAELNKSVTYTIIDNPDLNPSTCEVSVESAFLFDPQPAGAIGPLPTENNPFIQASINPKLKDGGSISHYDIHLRVPAEIRILTGDQSNPDEITHYFKYNGIYSYLIRKTSNEAVNLRIYATTDLVQLIKLDTIFNNEDYSSQPIFITTQLVHLSQNLSPPSIGGILTSSHLTKPPHKENFEFEIPTSNSIKSGSFLIGFVTDNTQNFYKKQLYAEFSPDPSNGYYNICVPYKYLYEGINHISYLVVTANNASRSKFQYIYYDSKNPKPGDAPRPLYKPRVFNQFNREIYEPNPISLNDIGNKGLEVWLRYVKDNSESIAIDDTITITVHISNCIDENEVKRTLPFKIDKNHVVKSDDVTSGYFKAHINANELQNYAPAGDNVAGSISIEYNRIPKGQTQSQNSKIFTTAFNTVLP